MSKAKEDALNAFNNENYKLALDLMLPLANEGDVDMMCNIGTLYQLGWGVKRNIEVAIYWLEKAAALGSGLSANNLSTLYMTCLPDMPLNPKLSKKWKLESERLNNFPFKPF